MSEEDKKKETVQLTLEEKALYNKLSEEYEGEPYSLDELSDKIDLFSKRRLRELLSNLRFKTHNLKMEKYRGGSRYVFVNECDVDIIEVDEKTQRTGSYSKVEEDFVRENFGDMSVWAMSKHIGRAESSVYNLLRKLDL